MMNDLEQMIKSYYSKDLEQRKQWYSPAAKAYNKARPSYPKKLVDRVVQVAQLSSNSKILEVGCVSGTATVAFAELGCSMVCLELNPDFYRFAKHNCKPYPNVEIQNISFEEWTLTTGGFDAVLAASSFHWIPPEIGYPKAANALRADGHPIFGTRNFSRGMRCTIACLRFISHLCDRWLAMRTSFMLLVGLND